MRLGKSLLLGAALAVGIPAAGLASVETSVAEIIESSAELAGLAVTVEGELIGDYGFRDDGFMWAQLNGDAYALEPIREGGAPVGGNTGIGIRMPIALGQNLDPPGRYRSRGPVVKITGVWKYHDPERQGESFLEVESLVVIEPGRALHQAPDWMFILLGGLLVGAGLAALLWRGRSIYAMPPD